MKLSLEELKVESYSTQVCERELTEVKGGTTPACVWAAVDIVAAAASVVGAYYAWKSYACSNQDASGGVADFTITLEDGTTISTNDADSTSVRIGEDGSLEIKGYWSE